MSLEVDPISELRAVAHPLRLQMLSLLTGAELSAAEVARELDITQANASYHLRLLHAAGLLVVGSEETVRGGRAKRYRHPWDAGALATSRPTESDDDKLAYVATMAAAVPARFVDRERGEKGSYTDADLWVDPQVWNEVLGLVERASRLMHGSARPPRTAGTVRANLSVAAFRLQAGSRGSR